MKDWAAKNAKIVRFGWGYILLVIVSSILVYQQTKAIDFLLFYIPSGLNFMKYLLDKKENNSVWIVGLVSSALLSTFIVIFVFFVVPLPDVDIFFPGVMLVYAPVSIATIANVACGLFCVYYLCRKLIKKLF